MPYGITNLNNPLDQSAVEHVLSTAKQIVITLLDTSPLYGNSESLIGTSLSRVPDYSVTTKIPSLTQSNLDPIEGLIQSVYKSAALLRGSSSVSYLLHSPDDIPLLSTKPFIDTIKLLKQSGHIHHFGASIYTQQHIDMLPLEHIDTVQLPLSIYDQRLLRSGSINYLVDNNIKVSARSIFLQGLILANPHCIPSWMPSSFTSHHSAFLEYCRQMSVTPLQLSLSFVLSLSSISSVIVGISSIHELLDISQSLLSDDIVDTLDTSQFAYSGKSNVLDPRTWP